MKVFYCIFFKQDAFHVGDRQRTPKLILHKVLHVYPHINFINKGMPIFRNFMCNATHNE